MPRGGPKYGHKETLKPRRKLAPLAPTSEKPKAQATISTSNILRRKPLKEVYGKKHSRRREHHHELFLEYQDRIEDSRTSLRDTSHAALAQTQASLSASLATLQSHEQNFHDTATEHRQLLLAPIADERVETNFSRDGKSVTEVLQIGPRAEAFKVMLASKRAELELAWTEWDKVQKRIVRLGVRVLGAEAVGVVGGAGVADGSGDVGGDGEEEEAEEEDGYASKMRELELEHEKWLEEVGDEIRITGEETVRMMEATEKELAATSKKEKMEFLTKLIEEDE